MILMSITHKCIFCIITKLQFISQKNTTTSFFAAGQNTFFQMSQVKCHMVCHINPAAYVVSFFIDDGSVKSAYQ